VLVSTGGIQGIQGRPREKELSPRTSLAKSPSANR
jgi:hypothetical protein